MSGFAFEFTCGRRALVLCIAFLCASLYSAEAAQTNPPGKSKDVLDFTNHIARLQKRVPKGFTIVVQPPFVVTGDEPAAVVRRRAANTVQWAVDRLKQDFFRRDPEEVIDIWLFKDKASYEKHAWELFGDQPTTPFGYYSQRHQALVMNISTGGGTLVHEIVHPFMRANFPECPAWFNEGMGSLFEQCGDRNGHIVGYTNWRLPRLQVAIKRGELPSFPKMMAMTEGEFYGPSSGARYSQHYAQARYLCYYLQEQGLLAKYYREFSAHAKQDPAGIKTLKSVLGEEDLDAFQQKWEAFVLKLTFE